KAHRRTQNRSASTRAQDVGVSNIQRIAGDGDVEIVLERKRNGVIQREIELAIMHERIDARRVRQVRRSQMSRPVWRDRIGKMRGWLRIVQDRDGARFRRRLWRGTGGRFLCPTCDGESSE